MATSDGPKLYITEHRERLGLSIEGLATVLGVERQTVWRWENSRRGLNQQKIATVASALQMRPEDLWHPPPPEGQASETEDKKVAEIVARVMREMKK